MSILDSNVVDFVAIGRDHIALVKTDAIEWGQDEEFDVEHLYLLQESINGCIAYFESGQLAREYPDDAHLPVKIFLVPVHPISDQGKELLDEAATLVAGIGLELVIDPNFGLEKDE